MINRLSTLLILLVFAGAAQAVSLAGSDGTALDVSRVAVVVFAQGDTPERYARTAQARMETILQDNGIEVIDRDEVEQLKDVWTLLEDPAYFVTAEAFLDNAGQYEIDGIVRLYLLADTARSLGGFHSATAQADTRFVGSDATVAAFTSYPMGAPGRPPSDGLTEAAALINAVQRAVDDAAGGLNLELLETATPRSLQLAFEGPTAGPAGVPAELRANASESDPWVAAAELSEERWSSEKITCTALAPAGGLGVVGTKVSELNRKRRKIYGSKLHVVDTEQQREIYTFVTNEVGLKDKKHRGDSAVLDCLFLGSWRYLAATTGDVLSLWDTERGVAMAEILLPDGLNAAQLDFLRDEAGDFVRVGGKRSKSWAYRIVRAQ